MNNWKKIISQLLCNLNSYLIIILSLSYSLYDTWNSQNGMMKNIFISFWNFAPSFLEVCCLTNIEIGYIFGMKRQILKNKIFALMDNILYLLSSGENEENNCFRNDRQFLDIFIRKYRKLNRKIQIILQRTRNRQNPGAINGIRRNNRIPIPRSRRLRRLGRLRIRIYRR